MTDQYMVVSYLYMHILVCILRLQKRVYMCFILAFIGVPFSLG